MHDFFISAHIHHICTIYLSIQFLWAVVKPYDHGIIIKKNMSLSLQYVKVKIVLESNSRISHHDSIKTDNMCEKLFAFFETYCTLFSSHMVNVWYHSRVSVQLRVFVVMDSYFALATRWHWKHAWQSHVCMLLEIKRHSKIIMLINAAVKSLLKFNQSLHDNYPSHPWIKTISKFDLENQMVKVIEEARDWTHHPIDLLFASH